MTQRNLIEPLLSTERLHVYLTSRNGSRKKLNTTTKGLYTHTLLDWRKDNGNLPHVVSHQ